MTQPPRGILLDIEGTTSSVRFVYDVMFPFARRELEAYLLSHWGDESLQPTLDAIARDASQASFAEWCAQAQVDPGSNAARQLVREEIVRLMEGDVKATGLKQLQGLIWQSGFASGELQAHVYDDIPPALERWRQAGCDVRIYSSGSVHAQQLFFAHTTAGDLLPNFQGHYDTTTGPKRAADSYRRIAEAFGLPAAEILFASDIPAELDAAREAGMQTLLLVRPENAPVPADHGHPSAESFAEVG